MGKSGPGMRILIAGLSIAVLALSPAQGAEPSAGDQCAALAAYIWEPGFRETGIAWDKIDVNAALPVCRAAQGESPHDPPTLFRLARIYLQVKNFDLALPLLLEASEAGYAPAQTAYGTAYMRGDMGQPDHLVAFRWLKAASQNGNPVAKANLGIMYLGRHSIPMNAELYAQLQLEAAEAGVDFAQDNVGWMYEHGYVLGYDPVLAEAWYRLAAAQDFLPAKRSLGQFLSRSGDTLGDYDEAFGLLTSAAALGDGPSATQVGWMHSGGVGRPVDFELAREAYEEGLRLGDPAAAYLLGDIYEWGRGVPADRDRAFPYYLQGAWLGHAAAQARVGFFVRSGLGGAPNDDAAALAWFVRAAEQGNVFAQVSAAEMYRYRFHDEPVPAYHDPQKARYWYEAAARAGDLGARLEMAIYLVGEGDFETARTYIEDVLQNGDEMMVERAHHTIEIIQFLRRAEKLPV
jgi:TPR repeat protein